MRINLDSPILLMPLSPVVLVFSNQFLLFCVNRNDRISIGEILFAKLADVTNC